MSGQTPEGPSSKHLRTCLRAVKAEKMPRINDKNEIKFEHAKYQDEDKETYFSVGLK